MAHVIAAPFARYVISATELEPHTYCDCDDAGFADELATIIIVYESLRGAI